MVEAHGAGSVLFRATVSRPSQHLHPRLHQCSHLEEDHTFPTLWRNQVQLQSDIAFGAATNAAPPEPVAPDHHRALE